MKSLLVALFIAAITVSFAETPATQQELPETHDDASIRDAVFGEVAGNGMLLSLNCEKFVTRDFGIRIGIGTLTGEHVAVPLMFNYYRGRRYKLELGVGFVFLPRWNSNLSVGKEGSAVISSTVGLRFQPEDGGVLLRFSFTPYHDLAYNRFHLYGGLSLGLAL